jgi:hypothetical protein
MPIARSAKETVAELQLTNWVQKLPQLHPLAQFHRHDPNINHTDIVDRFVHDLELSKSSSGAFHYTKIRTKLKS